LLNDCDWSANVKKFEIRSGETEAIRGWDKG